MPDLTPEQAARQQIDAQLAACGWAVQDYKWVDFSAGWGSHCAKTRFVIVDAVGVCESDNTESRPLDRQPPGIRSHRRRSRSRLEQFAKIAENLK